MIHDGKIINRQYRKVCVWDHIIQGNLRNLVRSIFDSFFLKEIVEGADTTSLGRAFHGNTTRDEK